MFEKLRHSLDDLMARATRPEERREVVARMKDALVHARIGLEDLRGGVEQTRARVAAERRELETVQRRKSLAEGIADAETVKIAERFERQHLERLQVLEAKLQAQEAELALVEREVGEMTSELRRASLGATVPPGAAGSMGNAGSTGSTGSTGPASEGSAPGAPPDAGSADADPLLDQDAALREELDAVARQSRRARQAEDAEARLAELKRRMGK